MAIVLEITQSHTHKSHIPVCEYYNWSTWYIHKIAFSHIMDCSSTNYGLIISHEVHQNLQSEVNNWIQDQLQDFIHQLTSKKNAHKTNTPMTAVQQQLECLLPKLFVTRPTLCIILHTVTRFRTNKQKQKSHIRLELSRRLRIIELHTHINIYFILLKSSLCQYLLGDWFSGEENVVLLQSKQSLSYCVKPLPVRNCF